MWDENKVRMIDIAEELGVSTATVSNVLHGKTKKVSEQTVKRVQEKLRQRGYIPNMAATLLAQNNSRIVGVVINDHPKYEGHLLEDPFVAGMLNALSDALEQAGFFLMLKKSRRIMDAVSFASMWNMDGMILMGFCEDDYQHLRDSIRIPFVVCDGIFKNEGNICNLMLDDRDGGKQAGRYLRENGHDEVLCIADNRLCPDAERYEGLCEGLGKKASFWEIPMIREERIQYYEARFEPLKRYTAVFALSDYYAVDILQYLRGKGLLVPEDLSVIGFDDTVLGRMMSPSLTTIRQDVKYRAEKAVDCLIKMNQDQGYSQTEIIPVSLVIRESSGPHHPSDQLS